jgi:hypothetical protein
VTDAEDRAVLFRRLAMMSGRKELRVKADRAAQQGQGAEEHESPRKSEGLREGWPMGVLL